MEFDVSAYLGVFIDEVDEQLQILNNEVLILENDPNNSETIDRIFRAAHTLKGSSAAMGFEKMKELTHHLENIFDQIRKKQLFVTTEVVDLIFNSIDDIQAMKEAIIQGKQDELNVSTAVDVLVKTNQQNAIKCQPIQLNDYQQNVATEAQAMGYSVVQVNIQLAPDTMMKDVRLLIIHNALKEMGEIVVSIPSTEEIEQQKFESDTFSFVILTMHSTQHIVDQANHWTDVEQVEVYHLQTRVPSKTTTEKTPTSEKGVIEEKTDHKAKVASTVRVDVEKLEHLMNLVGELVIDQTRLVDVRSKFSEKSSHEEEEFEVLDEVTNHLSRVISELQEGMMKTRMLPIEQLFNRFPRMVRDTAAKADKQIQFDMIGKETELDRTLIEEISDPIIHLLRNAVDHGVETSEERVVNGKPAVGQITLKATHEENNVVITIADDGKGINPQKIKEVAISKGIITEQEAQMMTDKDAMFLIFKSGFSTAKEVTDISGRGVGMDIVKSHIEKLNGVIDIESTVGIGTKFIIKLPLTLAIIRSLLVQFGSKTFAIPLVNVLEIIRLNTDEIQVVKNQEIGMVRDRILPLVRMKNHLGIIEESITQEKKREFVVVVGIADKRIGIIADKTIGNQEIVIKSLGSYIGTPPYISGATIMGDGNVALILDVSLVIKELGAEITETNELKETLALDEERQVVTFKLDDEEYALDIYRTKDIITVPNITKVAKTERDLLGIINLRGQMVPVYDLKQRLSNKVTQFTKKSRIIVVEHGEQDIGFLVDEVTQVLKVNKAQIEQPNEFDQYNQSKLIEGIGKLHERLILILAFDNILASVQTVNITQQVEDIF